MSVKIQATVLHPAVLIGQGFGKQADGSWVSGRLNDLELWGRSQGEGVIGFLAAAGIAWKINF